MIKKIGILTTILLICGLVINFGYVQADLINGGFEEGVVDQNGVPITLGEGKYTTNKTILGWQIIGDTTDNYYGVFNPGPDDYSGIAPEGSNVAYIENYELVDPLSGGFGYMGIEQTFSMNLDASLSYYLHVDIGNTGGEDYAGFPGYKVELLGDGFYVEDYNLESPGEGEFVTTTLALDGLSSGEDLTIRLLNTGLDGAEIDFDNVRINTNADPTTPTPEPATMLLLGLGLVGLVGLNKRKK